MCATLPGFHKYGPQCTLSAMSCGMDSQCLWVAKPAAKYNGVSWCGAAHLLSGAADWGQGSAGGVLRRYAADSLRELGSRQLHSNSRESRSAIKSAGPALHA